jgi:ketosteroid isomerase-like protein
MLAALAAPERAPALDDTDPAHGSTGSHEPVALEDEFARAVVKRDAANLERLLAKGFVYTENDETMTREALVAALTTGAERVESAANEGMTVHDFGSACVVTGWLVTRGQAAGRPFSRRYRFTDTWQRQDGQWKLIAAQDYLVPDPGR